MWLMIAVLIVCFTLIVMFRMYLDLRRQDQQHIRLLQNDHRSHEKYLRVTRQEAIGEMTKVLSDLKQGKYVLEPPSEEQIMKSIGSFREGPPDRPSDQPVMIPYKQAKLDPRLMTVSDIASLQEAEYRRFILQQQQQERDRIRREARRRYIP